MPYYEIESALTYNFTSGDYVLFSSGGVASKCNVYSGAHVSIGPKGAASGTSVFSGGHMAFLSGSLPGKDNKVLTGGVLSVGLGTQPGNIDAANGAILQLTMGGTWFVQRPTDYVIASNGTQIKKTGTTSTTSDGIVYAGYTGWDMKTPGCTLNIVDFASAAFVKVSSGCSLGLGGGHGYGAGAAGQIDVYSGGSAVLEKANYVGLATVHSGGTMTLGAYSENTTVMENGGYLYIPDESILLPDLYPDYDLNVRIKPNTFKDLVLSGPYQSATAHSGTVASHVTLKGSAGLDVFEEQPLSPDSPLWRMPTVYITPHCTPQVPDRQAATIAIIRENARRFEASSWFPAAACSPDSSISGPAPCTSRTAASSTSTSPRSRAAMPSC